jgi:ubiquinone/menaquinone biosynthesis C-methylase UbiE
MGEGDIRSIYGYDKKILNKSDIDFDKTGEIRPAWIKIKNEINSKFLTINFGYGNLNYVEFLQSKYFIPFNYSTDELRKVYDKFAETYEEVIKNFGNEVNAIEHTINLISFDKKNKPLKVLDIGSGTGRGAEILINQGYKDITLLELSSEMLNKAKQKKSLKKCVFICSDFNSFDTNDRFDLITSFFAFGSPSYFTEEEIKNGLLKIKEMLNEKGRLLVVGMKNTPTFSKNFKILTFGDFLLKDGLKTHYIIGEKLP